MVTIRTPNLVDENSPYIDEILEQMIRLGPPTIRAFWDTELERWHAIEGSHRLFVAHKNNIPVFLLPVNGDDMIQDHDISGFYGCETPVSMLLREISSWESEYIEFNDDLITVLGRECAVSP